MWLKWPSKREKAMRNEYMELAMCVFIITLETKPLILGMDIGTLWVHEGGIHVIFLRKST